MKKIIASLIITILMIAYFVLYFGLLIFIIKNAIIRVLLGVIPVVFAALMIYVCMQRIKEIRSGEEDDLSKY